MATKYEIDELNRRLKTLYGCELDGRPKFRIVWSEDQYEYRKGIFENWYGSIFLSREECVKEVRKYSYIKDRWILEKLILASNPELPNSRNGSYEPVFVFQNKDGVYLEPIWAAIELLMYALTGPRQTLPTPNEDEELEKEKQIFLERIQDASPYIPGMLHDKCAVTVPGDKTDEVHDSEHSSVPNS